MKLTFRPDPTPQQHDAITCPRCGETHTDVVLEPLTNPSERAFQPTHFAMCPTLGEPIFASVSVTDATGMTIDEVTKQIDA